MGDISPFGDWGEHTRGSRGGGSEFRIKKRDYIKFPYARSALIRLYFRVIWLRVLGGIKSTDAGGAVNSESNNDVNSADAEIVGMPHYISNVEFMARFIQIKIWVEFYTRNMVTAERKLSFKSLLVPYCFPGAPF